jgi:site-specific recombinase XerD
LAVSKKFSLAVAAGADVKAVQQMLGHASVATHSMWSPTILMSLRTGSTVPSQN